MTQIENYSDAVLNLAFHPIETIPLDLDDLDRIKQIDLTECRIK